MSDQSYRGGDTHGRQGSGMECFYCKETGHRKPDCPKLKKQLDQKKGFGGGGQRGRPNRGQQEETFKQMEEDKSFYDKQGTKPGDEDWGGPEEEEIPQEKKEEKNGLSDLFKPAEDKTDLLANEQKSKVTRDPRLKGLPEPTVIKPEEEDPWEMRVAEKKAEPVAAAASIDEDDDWGVREKYTPTKDNDKDKNKEAKPAEDDDWGVRDKSVEKGEIIEENGSIKIEKDISNKVKNIIEKSKSPRNQSRRSPGRRSRSPQKSRRSPTRKSRSPQKKSSRSRDRDYRDEKDRGKQNSRYDRERQDRDRDWDSRSQQSNKQSSRIDSSRSRDKNANSSRRQDNKAESKYDDFFSRIEDPIVVDSRSNQRLRDSNDNRTDAYNSRSNTPIESNNKSSWLEKSKNVSVNQFNQPTSIADSIASSFGNSKQNQSRMLLSQLDEENDWDKRDQSNDWDLSAPNVSSKVDKNDSRNNNSNTFQKEDINSSKQMSISWGNSSNNGGNSSNSMRNPLSQNMERDNRQDGNNSQTFQNDFGRYNFNNNPNNNNNNNNYGRNNENNNYYSQNGAQSLRNNKPFQRDSWGEEEKTNENKNLPYLEAIKMNSVPTKSGKSRMSGATIVIDDDDEDDIRKKGYLKQNNNSKNIPPNSLSRSSKSNTENTYKRLIDGQSRNGDCGDLSPVYEPDTNSNKLKKKNNNNMLVNPDQEQEWTMASPTYAPERDDPPNKNGETDNNRGSLALENFYDFDKEDDENAESDFQSKKFSSCVTFLSDSVLAETDQMYLKEKEFFEKNLLQCLYPHRENKDNCFLAYEGHIKMKKQVLNISEGIDAKVMAYSNHSWSQLQIIPSLKQTVQRNAVKEFKPLDFSIVSKTMKQMIKRDHYERMFYLLWLEGATKEDNLKLNSYSKYLFDNHLVSGINMENFCFTMAHIGQIFPGVQSFKRPGSSTPVKLVLIVNLEVFFQIGYRPVPF